MIDEATASSAPVPRNRPGRVALVASIFFLIPTLITLGSNGYSLSAAGSQFLKTCSDDHPLKFFLGLTFEITFLSLPFTFLSCLIVILAGVRGLNFARKSGTGVGRRESIVGIGLALLVMLLCFMGALQWGSAWRQ